MRIDCNAGGRQNYWPNIMTMKVEAKLEQLGPGSFVQKPKAYSGEGYSDVCIATLENVLHKLEGTNNGGNVQ